MLALSAKAYLYKLIDILQTQHSIIIHNSPLYDKWFSLQRLQLAHKNGLVKMIQIILHNQYLSFKFATLNLV